MIIVVLYFGNSPNTHSRRRKRRAIRMLVVIVAMFALTWCPVRVLRIIMYVAPSLIPRSEFLIIRPVISSLAFANSWMNPAIYAVFGSNFRREFTRILRCRQCSNEEDTKRFVDRRYRYEKREVSRIEQSPDDRTAHPSINKDNNRPNYGDQCPDGRQTTATQTEVYGLCSYSDSQRHENLTFTISSEILD
ncbi:substance-P receptor-like [Ptychodera flava]|uniref:substance-P receptor-like n=1 Tax=Ptychodera flava TaxID=63121 RepID=UPI00396A88CD